MPVVWCEHFLGQEFGTSMRIVTVLGARPQFIKASVVSQAIREADRVEETILHTGQHFDFNMSKVFFDELDIPHPAINLGIGGGTHGQNTGRMLEGVERYLLEQRPDWVLVYGDTDSTLAATLAAVKLGIPVAHVEAGLRSFNRAMPEEINRILTDHAAELLFTPCQTASQQLEREGIHPHHIHFTGDVMFDAALHFGRLAGSKSKVLEHLQLDPKRFVLATLHRKENVDQPERLKEIVAGFAASDQLVVWPVHPRTRRQMAALGLDCPKTVRMIEPVGYLDMIRLEQAATLIVTDSGGVQKEAFFHQVPCVTVRDETEWTELVAMGCNRLVSADRLAVAEALAKPLPFPPIVGTPYGTGTAAPLIAGILAGTAR